MSFEKNLIDAENLAHTITTIELLSNSEKGKKAFKPVDFDELDSREHSAYKETVIEQLPDAYARHPEPAQETQEERAYRMQQIAYERNVFYEENKALARSIISLAEHNFANRVLAAACDFEEMAENHPRSVFIRNFGNLIEEELKADPSKPSKRLASFATSYFWKEANHIRMINASLPSRHKTITRDELIEFFALPVNSEADKNIADYLPDQIIGKIIEMSGDEENKTIRLDFRHKKPYVSLEETDSLEQSIHKLAQQNFTNRLLLSTSHYATIINPFNAIRSVASFGPAIEQELKTNPDKPSPTLVTMATEKGFGETDAQVLIDGVKQDTTKEELSEFFTTREHWSTGLRMIDYLNHHVVVEMSRFLPDQDRLDLWSLRPELINGIHVGGSLQKLSQNVQREILNTVADPIHKKSIQEDIQRKLVGGIHVMGVGCVDPKTLDIPGQFADIRKRRICSHEDNKRFFRAHENYRSSY